MFTRGFIIIYKRISWLFKGQSEATNNFHHHPSLSNTSAIVTCTLMNSMYMYIVQIRTWNLKYLGFGFFQVWRQLQQEEQFDCFNSTQFSPNYLDGTSSGSVQILLFVSSFCRTLKSGLGSNSYPKSRTSELLLFPKHYCNLFLSFPFFHYNTNLKNWGRQINSF